MVIRTILICLDECADFFFVSCLNFFSLQLIKFASLKLHAALVKSKIEI